MIKLPLVGPAYKLNAQSMSCQNCINWFPQTIEYPNGSRVAALMPTPGLKKIFQGESATVRCLHVLSNGALLVVIGTKLYHSKSNKFELIEVGSISALNTVKVADNGIVAILVNGTYSYSLDMKTLELNRLSGSSIPRSTHVLFLDGRFIVNKANTGQFHWSDLYSDKFDALSYATAESSPDKITALTTFNRELWIFGAQTVERYYSTGSQNSPYARLSGGAMAFGCIAPDSIVALATGVIWLSQSEFGGHQIVMSGGGVPERISTHAIEEDISQYKKTTDAIAYAYQQEGHVFYVISFPSANTTFCFDVSTGLWHQRSFANEQGLHERHRSQHHAFFNGIHIVGDYKNGKLYQLDKQTFTDDGELVLRERTAQAVITEGKTTRFNNLEIVCEVGFEEKAVHSVDTSAWDIEYVLYGETFRTLTGNPIPYGFSDNVENITESTSLVINNTITEISNNAFVAWNSATTLSISDTVDTIGNYAFWQWNSAQSLIIPDSVVSIGNHAFRFWSQATELVLPNNDLSIGSTAFSGWTSAQSLTIPPNVTSIGIDSFSHWTSATSLVLSANLSTIPLSAFHSWYAANSLVIPNGVEIIGEQAFHSWTSATTLVIPASVTSIGNDAFNGWLSATSITVHALNPPLIGNNAFYQTNNAPIYVPSSSVSAYKAALGWSAYASRIFAIP